MKVVQFPKQSDFVKELSDQIRPFWLRNDFTKTVFLFFLKRYLKLLFDGKDCTSFERVLFQKPEVLKSFKERWLELVDKWQKRIELLEEMFELEFLYFLKDFGIAQRMTKK
jgi:hypothetical protein